MDERLLMVPGPTNLSLKVREALAQPQLGHTDPDFVKTFYETIQLARKAFKNNNGFQFIITGTGTVGMEAAVSSTVEPGDKVLVVNTGYFGERMVDINKVYGGSVEELGAAFGTHVSPDDVRKKLAETKFKALYVTHVDTGTTVCNPVAEIVKEAKNAGVTAIVDGVCSVGGVPFDFDASGADLAFTGSQKALAAPPGTVLIAVSKDFLAQLEAKKERIRTYYANLTRWKPIMENPSNYFATPAVQLIQALNQALKEVDEEGLEKRWLRHKTNAEIVRKGIQATGIKLVVEPGFQADTVTGVWTETGVAPTIQEDLRRQKFVVARGLGENNVKMLRIGHMGNLTDKQAKSFVDAFVTALRASRFAGRPVLHN